MVSSPGYPPLTPVLAGISVCLTSALSCHLTPEGSAFPWAKSPPREKSDKLPHPLPCHSLGICPYTSPPETSVFSSVKQIPQRTDITGLSEEQMLFQISLNIKCTQISEISKYVCAGVTCILKSMIKQHIKQQAHHTA